MAEKTAKPAIRFAGFTDAWEQRKAKELFESTADKGHPELSVLSATQDRGMIRRDENSINISHDKKNEDGYKRVLPGQFVIHLRSFQGGFAHSAIEGITSPAYTVFGFLEQEKHDDNFWKYVFTSKEFIRRLETVTYGIRDGRSISYDEVLTLSFTYPCKDEQRMIAQYFDCLDTLITLHQRKYDKMVCVKKSMLEKMFPKNGESVPEIRFAGFTDAWEQRKLGGVCAEFKSGDFIRAEDIRDMGAYPVFGGNGLRGYTGRYNHEGDYALIGRQGALCGNMNYSSGKAYFTEHAVAVKANVLNETLFLFYLLGTMNLGQYSGQSAQPGLAVGNLVELEAKMPQKTEQQEIGTFFHHIDNLITLHQRELEKLKNLKKAMLEKMFV